MQQYSTVLVLSAVHLLVYLQLTTEGKKQINLRSAARRIYDEVDRLAVCTVSRSKFRFIVCQALN